jgi:flagellar protein FlaG
MITNIQPTGTLSPAAGPGLLNSDLASHDSKAPARQPLTSEEEQAMVRELNTAMRIIGTKLSFSIDDLTKKTVVRVMDADTGELIRQIPPDEMLRVAARITELLGVLFDDIG